MGVVAGVQGTLYFAQGAEEILGNANELVKLMGGSEGSGALKFAQEGAATFAKAVSSLTNPGDVQGYIEAFKMKTGLDIY